MAEQYDFAKEAATSIYAVSDDEAVKLACEARERYDHDWASALKSGERLGIAKGMKKGIQQEQKNTEREKKRADEAEAKLREALDEIARLKAAAN